VLSNDAASLVQWPALGEAGAANGEMGMTTVATGGGMEPNRAKFSFNPEAKEFTPAFAAQPLEFMPEPVPEFRLAPITRSLSDVLSSALVAASSEDPEEVSPEWENATGPALREFMGSPNCALPPMLSLVAPAPGPMGWQELVPAEFAPEMIPGAYMAPAICIPAPMPLVLDGTDPDAVALTPLGGGSIPPMEPDAGLTPLGGANPGETDKLQEQMDMLHFMLKGGETTCA